MTQPDGRVYEGVFTNNILDGIARVNENSSDKYALFVEGDNKKFVKKSQYEKEKQNY